VKNAELTFNFGATPLKYKPADCKSLEEADIADITTSSSNATYDSSKTYDIDIC
jgi:hypothetical protein